MAEWILYIIYFGLLGGWLVVALLLVFGADWLARLIDSIGGDGDG